jgi:hypothetical protein
MKVLMLPRLFTLVNADQTSGQVVASSSCGTLSSYKTCDEGADDHDSCEGLEHGVELRNGGILATPSSHPQHIHPTNDDQVPGPGELHGGMD